MRLGAGGEGGDFFVPDVHPFDIALATNGVCQTIEAVADNAVYALYPRRDEELDKLICDCSWHISALQRCVYNQCDGKRSTTGETTAHLYAGLIGSRERYVRAGWRRLQIGL
jgi:hypothetical protein